MKQVFLIKLSGEAMSGKLGYGLDFEYIEKEVTVKDQMVIKSSLCEVLDYPNMVNPNTNQNVIIILWIWKKKK